jgi:hypothetical protein
LEVTKKAGLSCIEWGSDVHAPCQDIRRLHEIATLQKEYGIFCSSYGTYFRLGETPIGDLEKYISAAKILDTDILRLWCGTKSGAQMTETERMTLLAQCKEAAHFGGSSVFRDLPFGDVAFVFQPILRAYASVRFRGRSCRIHPVVCDLGQTVSSAVLSHSFPCAGPFGPTGHLSVGIASH